MKAYRKNRSSAISHNTLAGLTVLLLLFAVLAALIVTRWVQSQNDGSIQHQVSPTEAQQETVQDGSGAAVFPETLNPAEEMPQNEESSVPLEQSFPSESGEDVSPRYTPETYQLVTDIVHICRNEGMTESANSIAQLLQELEQKSPNLGLFWRRTLDYLAYTDRDLVINRGAVPEGLPEDDSLCIAVLGFQLLYDGGMTPELQGRCELALTAAERYPNAWIAVTGGGTAAGNCSATEADVMADWFASHGIAADRIIIENRSLTTDQNAVNACKILTDYYPQVKQILVVTSDYHVPLGGMMFSEAAYLYSMETGNPIPFSVAANMAYTTSGNPEYSGVKNLLSYIWVMADPHY